MGNIQQTSLLAFSEIRNDLGPRQAAVADALEQIGPANNRELAKHLHWDINTVTPRCLELRRKGIVKLSRQDVSAEGRRVNFWELV